MINFILLLRTISDPLISHPKDPSQPPDLKVQYSPQVLHGEVLAEEERSVLLQEADSVQVCGGATVDPGILLQGRP